jgi:hypothetical protein
MNRAKLTPAIRNEVSHRDPTSCGTFDRTIGILKVFSCKIASERELPQILPARVQLSSAARTLPSSASSSKGFARNSTAPALSACIRIFVSPCAVMKIVGILQCSAFSLACNSRPDIPGIRISAIRHAVWCCWPDFKKSSADAKAWDGNPTDFSMPCKALRIESSSSTIATRFVFDPAPTIKKLAVSSNLHNHTLVCDFLDRLPPGMLDGRTDQAAISARTPGSTELRHICVSIEPNLEIQVR